MARYLERILSRFHKQEQKGISKYGQRLEDNHRPVSESIEFALEEVTDLMMYLEETKEKIERMDRVVYVAKWVVETWDKGLGLPQSMPVLKKALAEMEE
jgi:hypothetical protein